MSAKRQGSIFFQQSLQAFADLFSTIFGLRFEQKSHSIIEYKLYEAVSMLIAD